MRVVRSTARVRVPATSANLGPGFDSMGLAHNLWDEVSVRLTTGSTRVQILGEGRGSLPTDDSHLVVRALRRGLDAAGLAQSGIELTCRNGIPQGRGLGSSAAATVAGLMLVRGLVDHPEEFTDSDLLRLATEFEGHPDNAAPAIYGGAVLSWTSGSEVRVARINIAPNVAATLLIPDAELDTHTARSVLPELVPHADAAFNSSRAALLVLALERHPELLLDATEDRLHQDYRAKSMPGSHAMMKALRDAGWPAVISGAGPSVLIFDRLDSRTSQIITERGFKVMNVGIGRAAHVVEQ